MIATAQRPAPPAPSGKNRRAGRDDDAVFRALADGGRRQLLDRLRARNGQSLSELCVKMGMSRQAVAKHLALLEEANLVATAWQGREKLHFLNPVPIQGMAERWIRPFETQRLQALADLKRELENPQGA